jgi:membrane protein
MNKPFDRILKWILWPAVALKRVTSRLIIPGFDGMSLYSASSFFFRGLWRGSITTRAAALSFTFFLALFPAILFFFTLIPYIPIHGLQHTLLSMLKDVLPASTYTQASSTIEDIIIRQHGKLLSIGFLTAVYFSTSGINGIMLAFNNSIHVKETRPFFRQKAIALLLVVIVSVLAIIAIALVAGGSNLLHFLQREGIIKRHFVYYTLMVCKWIIIVVLFFFVVSFLYYFAPAKHGRFRFISPGSTLATFLFILTSIGFDFYISHFASYNKLYGSIGALIIILVWIYFNAIVLLIGFELNASILNARKERAKKEINTYK